MTLTTELAVFVVPAREELAKPASSVDATHAGAYAVHSAVCAPPHATAATRASRRARTGRRWSGWGRVRGGHSGAANLLRAAQPELPVPCPTHAEHGRCAFVHGATLHALSANRSQSSLTPHSTRRSPRPHMAHDGRRVWALRYVAQQYAWGKVRLCLPPPTCPCPNKLSPRSSAPIQSLPSSSLRRATRLMRALPMRVRAHASDPLSALELWIGTHVNGPSRLRTGPLLADHIAQHPSRVLGEACAAFGSGRLPFLLKVLAIRQPLSLQAHPDKELAHALHAEQPEIYKARRVLCVR